MPGGQLMAERQSNLAGAAQAQSALDVQERAEHQRLERLDQRVANRLQQERSRRQALTNPGSDALRRSPRPARCVAPKAPAAGATCAGAAWRTHARRREQVHQLTQCQGAVRLAEQRAAAIERDAGRAALKAEELARRFGLTGEVPCAGTDLQGRCKLLADAREAQTLIPNAQAQVARLVSEKSEVQRELIDARRRCGALAGAPHALARAEVREAVARAGEPLVGRAFEGPGVRAGAGDPGRDRAGTSGAGAAGE
jgi:exonuclease SbcC